MNKLIITLAVSALAICTFAQERGEGGSHIRRRERGGMQANPEAKLHRFSTTIEKERPQLNQETQDLIAAYRRNPSDANYAEFVRATGRKPPRGWEGSASPEGKDRHPVVNVSYDDAVAYCAWLTETRNSKFPDRNYSFRLPTEEEWELAAGHMPKDADFNCKDTHPEIATRDLQNDKLPSGMVLTMPVDAYEKTLSACGAIDMWGNCWEWTSTDIIAQNGRERGRKVKEIKGGSWYAHRTSCRTEMRGEGRAPSLGYNTVGFRVVQEAK